MAIFAVTYRYSDDVAARDEHRAAHREHLAQVEGLLLSGPLDEPAGALIIIDAPSLEVVEEALAQDPFAREGVVVERTIRPYNPVMGALTSALTDHVER